MHFHVHNTMQFQSHVKICWNAIPKKKEKTKTTQHILTDYNSLKVDGTVPKNIGL